MQAQLELRLYELQGENVRSKLLGGLSLLSFFAVSTSAWKQLANVGPLERN